MTELCTHKFDGCAPTPLASYLKALGVLRLLATAASSVKGEAADANARGWWSRECFHLRTRLDRDALLRFLLEDYAPSPIIAPWNGRAGFLEGDAGLDSNRTGAQLINAIERGGAARLGTMRSVIATLRREPMLVRYNKLRADIKAAGEEEKRLIGEAKVAASERRKALTRQAKEAKSELLPSLRSNADARHLDFIDACFVLAEDERAAPLLGSGGNDGSRDFGVNFAEALDALVNFDTGTPKTVARDELEASIFSIAEPLEKTGAIGQFEPGQGGPNGSTSHEGWNPLNRWDVLLVLEGTLLFAGALTRRWGVANPGRAAFPFTFEPTRAGSGVVATEDPNAPRGEIWTPLWSKPSSLTEIGTLLAEGRLTVGGMLARTGLDAARAIARLGVSRGISAFERYSLIQPDAKMPYQATPLGRFATPKQPRNDPITDLDSGRWLVHLRSTVGKNAPARARMAVRQLDDALFEIARKGVGYEGLQGALTALGAVVSWLASSREGREKVTPPPRLGYQWVYGADDRSAEFRVAAALASLGSPGSARPSAGNKEEEEPAPDPMQNGQGASDSGGPTNSSVVANAHVGKHAVRLRYPPPMAAHFVPLKEETAIRRLRRWAENDPPCAVWGAGSLVQNMIAVLERRLTEQALRGLEDKPLNGAASARLSDVAAFLEGPPAFDDARCAALLAGLVWAQPVGFYSGGRVVPIPFAYAVLKPLFTPDGNLRANPGSNLEGRQFLSESGKLPIPPGLLARLRRGAIAEAIREALRRAHASGISSPFGTAREFGTGIDPVRLAAALLIPLDESGLTRLMERAYPKNQHKEEIDDAA